MDTAVKAFVFIELSIIGETDKQVNKQINVNITDYVMRYKG